MAIKIYEKFAPRANPADGDYPYGSIKNESTPGAKDGTPLDAVWANDYAGFDAELFEQADITPSGSPDKLGASQRVDAIKLLPKPATSITRNGTTVDADLTTLENENVRSCAEWANLLVHGINPVIAGVGDSVMFGATVGSLGVQDPNNIMASVKKALSLLYNMYTLTPLNLGISGSTLNGMITGTDGSGSTFEQKLMEGGSLGTADIIYCNHGINDSQLDLGVELYRENLYKFVYLCRKYNSTPVLVTPNPNPIMTPLSSIIDEYKSKRLMNYVKMMRYVAKQSDCDLVDNFEYFTKTAKQVPINLIVPDGAHLSSAAYRQAGFNLAIPLLSVQHIAKTGDVVGLTQTTWFDNASINRQIQQQPTNAGTRCGATISFDRDMGSLVGINYPVVLDDPLKCVSMIGLQWPSGSKMNATVNEYSLFYPFSSEKVYGNTSYLNWDAENKVRRQMWAGLNIFNFQYDIADPSNYDGFAFSGLYVPETKFTSMTGDSVSAVKQPAIGNYDSITAMVYYSATDSIILADRSGSPCLAITKDSDIFTAKLYSNGTVVHSEAISLITQADGIYPTEIVIKPTQIFFRVSVIALTVAISTPMPELQVQTPWLTYHVEPSQVF